MNTQENSQGKEVTKPTNASLVLLTAGVEAYPCSNGAHFPAMELLSVLGYNI